MCKFEATTIDCASIILPMTPPEELAAPIKIAVLPNDALHRVIKPILSDAGSSGAKGRHKRPGFDASAPVRCRARHDPGAGKRRHCGARAQGKHSGRPRLKPEPTFLRLVGIPRPRGQGKVPAALPPPAYVVVW